ncbi:MAG: sterol desaturase family protein [Gammaproteobacteria bacterium]
MFFFSPDFFKSTAITAVQFAEQIFSLSIICFFLELILPERYPISIRARLRGIYFMVIYFWITSFFILCFNQTINLADYEPLIFLKLQWFSDSKIWLLRLLDIFATLLVSLVIYDFFYYWFHRLQHQIPFLWRFHSIHHSPRELSVWSNYHHFTEEIFRIIFQLLPAALLIKTTPMPLIFIFIISLQGIFSHAATRFNFGFLRYFILDSRYHRIHHSIEKQHWNKNFASQLPFWDIVFRTAYFPKTDEWPATGLAEVEEAKSAAEYLMRPFRKNWKKIKSNGCGEQY